MEPRVEKELTLRDVLLIYRRRRRIVYGVLLTASVLAAIYCGFCTRRYEASGTVQVQKESADSMGLDSLLSSASEAGSDALDANIEMQTQANILQSDSLALRTIETLGMENTADYRPHWNPIGWALDFMSPQGGQDPASAKLEDSPRRRQRALKIFSKNLTVKPVSGTRLIDITYLSSDPRLAAAVVNTLTQALADYAFQTRYTATNQASAWLSEQLGDLRKSSEDLQARVVSMQRESGIYSLGAVDAQGREEAYSSALDQLQQATQALNLAKQNRILRGAIAKAAETGDAEMLSGLAGNTVGGNSQGMNNSLTLLQNLRQQEATQEAALQEATEKFGTAYPKLSEMRGGIADLRQSIHEEVGRIKARAESDYNIALQAEGNTQSNYEQAKKQADVLNNKAIEYAIVRQEADDSRSLYEDLLKRLKEAGVLEGLRSSNITVVDPGRVPAKPKKPNVPLYMAVAACGGWFLGCCGALLVDTLDNKIHSVTDLEEIFHAPPLGVLPQLQSSAATEGQRPAALLAVTDPHSPYIEAMRAIRTSLLLSHIDAPPKVLLVTSSVTGEGKSLCALNLAAILAQGGKRTLLVDADLRRGSLRRNLALPQGPGLSALLAGHLAVAPVQPVPDVEGLDILIAGHTPPNPADLIGSTAMETWLQRFRGDYDFVVLDGTPALPVTDAVAINTFADTTLLLVRSGLAERPQVQRSYQMLRRDGAHYVGLVLNALDINDSSYYGYYGYRKDAYPYAKGEDHVQA